MIIHESRAMLPHPHPSPTPSTRGASPVQSACCTHCAQCVAAMLPDKTNSFADESGPFALHFVREQYPGNRFRRASYRRVRYARAPCGTDCYVELGPGLETYTVFPASTLNHANGVERNVPHTGVKVGLGTLPSDKGLDHAALFKVCPADEAPTNTKPSNIQQINFTYADSTKPRPSAECGKKSSRTRSRLKHDVERLLSRNQLACPARTFENSFRQRPLVNVTAWRQRSNIISLKVGSTVS